MTYHQKRKKSKILRKLTEPRTNRKIITIIKTHLSSAQHYDPEIAMYFHNYNMLRAGRDTEDDYLPMSGGRLCC